MNNYKKQTHCWIDQYIDKKFFMIEKNVDKKKFINNIFFSELDNNISKLNNLKIIDYENIDKKHFNLIYKIFMNNYKNHFFFNGVSFTIFKEIFDPFFKKFPQFKKSNNNIQIIDNIKNGSRCLNFKNDLFIIEDYLINIFSFLEVRDIFMFSMINKFFFNWLNSNFIFYEYSFHHVFPKLESFVDLDVYEDSYEDVYVQNTNSVSENNINNFIDNENYVRFSFLNIIILQLLKDSWKYVFRYCYKKGVSQQTSRNMIEFINEKKFEEIDFYDFYSEYLKPLKENLVYIETKDCNIVLNNLKIKNYHINTNLFQNQWMERNLKYDIRFLMKENLYGCLNLFMKYYKKSISYFFFVFNEEEQKIFKDLELITRSKLQKELKYLKRREFKIVNNEIKKKIKPISFKNSNNSFYFIPIQLIIRYLSNHFNNKIFEYCKVKDKNINPLYFQTIFNFYKIEVNKVMKKKYIEPTNSFKNLNFAKYFKVNFYLKKNSDKSDFIIYNSLHFNSDNFRKNLFVSKKKDVVVENFINFFVDLGIEVDLNEKFFFQKFVSNLIIHPSNLKKNIENNLSNENLIFLLNNDPIEKEKYDFFIWLSYIHKIFQSSKNHSIIFKKFFIFLIHSLQHLKKKQYSIYFESTDELTNYYMNKWIKNHGVKIMVINKDTLSHRHICYINSDKKINIPNYSLLENILEDCYFLKENEKSELFKSKKKFYFGEKIENKQIENKKFDYFQLENLNLTTLNDFWKYFINQNIKLEILNCENFNFQHLYKINFILMLLTKTLQPNLFKRKYFLHQLSIQLITIWKKKIQLLKKYFKNSFTQFEKYLENLEIDREDLFVYVLLLSNSYFFKHYPQRDRDDRIIHKNPKYLKNICIFIQSIIKKKIKVKIIEEIPLDDFIINQLLYGHQTISFCSEGLNRYFTYLKEFVLNNCYRYPYLFLIRILSLEKKETLLFIDEFRLDKSLFYKDTFTFLMKEIGNNLEKIVIWFNKRDSFY